ncbi:MAG: glycosyltransferase family 39 protein [Terracidiphilus sp.]
MTEKSIERPAIESLQGQIAPLEWLLVFSSCATLSILAVFWSWRHGALLNYGDAVAHLHIARRVFDCHQPRFSQLGSVWLPLPHILLLPFVQVYSWWADGLAGVFPSALAYLAACAGIYRLARRWLPAQTAALALAFFATNPNLLYLQTTAMTEPLFVCEMIWLAVWLVEWHAGLDDEKRRSNQRLWLIALVLFAAVFTRYDGWVMALLAWTGIGLTLAKRGELGSRAFWLASVLVVAAPVFWLVYNAAAFGDWLYFVRGPYSAAAIEMHTSVPGFPPHPGWHSPWVAFLFYMKAVELDSAAAAWGNTLLALGLIGAACAGLSARHGAIGWTLLLALPIPFYAYSVAFGSVPIFLPVWWPHSWYNLRYGIEVLPALALSLAFVAQLAISLFPRAGLKPRWASYAAALCFMLIAINALQMLRERPAVYVEGTSNIKAHRPYEEQIPAALKGLLARHPGAVILIDTSVDPEIVALTGIPLRQTINESDLEVYRNALAAPAAHAQIVLTYAGDEVDGAVKAHPEGLTEYRRFSAPLQPEVTLYVSDTLDASPAGFTLTRPAAAVIASLQELR